MDNNNISTNKDLGSKKKPVTGQSWKGTNMDQDTYGATGTNTKSTGSGAAGGFGAFDSSKKTSPDTFEQGYKSSTTPSGVTPKSSNTESSKPSASGTGDLQEMILKQINELGDLLERAGEKVEKAGFTKIGEAIYNLGDKLEHMKKSSGSKSSVKASQSYGSQEKADDSVEVESPMNTAMKTAAKTRSEVAPMESVEPKTQRPSGSDKSEAL